VSEEKNAIVAVLGQNGLKKRAKKNEEDPADLYCEENNWKGTGHLLKPVLIRD